MNLRRINSLLKMKFASFDSLNQKSKPHYNPIVKRVFDETGLCFVHIPKNGGTSVEALAFDNMRVGHRTWSEWKSIGGENYEDWVKFCIVREPVERFLSAYDYLHRGGRNPIDNEIGKRYVKPFNDVNAFTRSLARKRKCSLMSYFHFIPQTEFILDDDLCMVNKLLDFENFDVELALLLNVDAPKIKHENKTRGKRTCRSALDSTSLDILRRLYQKDFVLYEYRKNMSFVNDFFGETIKS